MKKEFEKVDTSGDGTLDKGELVAFLMKKANEADVTGDEDEMRNAFTRLADDMFSKIDIDGNGIVYLNEFVDSYFIEQRRLMERIEELKLQI